MSYQIQSGDCLWSIVQQHYGLTDDTDIANKINEIAQANNIQDVNLIFEGQTLELPGDGFVGGGGSRADAFHNWGNGQNDGSEFQMFDISTVDANTYAAELEKFAQEYVNKFDTDKDGSWNEEEFIKMASGGAENISEQEKAGYHKMFQGLNIDQDGSKLSAKEYAAQLFVADNNGANANGKLDGKFTLNEYSNAFKMPGEQGYQEISNAKLNFYVKNYDPTLIKILEQQTQGQTPNPNQNLGGLTA